MLRINANTSPAGAKGYYAAGDYYLDGPGLDGQALDGQELPGRWRGRGAAMLGLRGAIARADWDALCDNRDPRTGGPLTPRQKAGRRVGYDFNFHAPKGLSLLYGLTGDARLLGAFRASVDQTMAEMEAEVQVRVRSGGRNEDRTTGTMAWGEFVHTTARPVDGVPDPHLHAHCFVFNATLDPAEGRWKAGQFAGLKRDAPYFEAVFHSDLARRMEKLGLETVRTPVGWDLAGIDGATLARFSRRTAQVERAAEARGVTDPDAKAALGAATRSRKATRLAMAELRSLWRSAMTDAEQRSLDALADQIGREPRPEDIRAGANAVDRAIEHAFERAAVVPERTLLGWALRQGLGAASRESVEHAAARAPLVRAERDGRAHVTTRGVLEEESAMLAFARAGRGACRPIDPGRTALNRPWLNDGQKAAVRHVLGSRDRVVIVRGVAGAGKTTALQEIREAAQAAGVAIHAFAPSAAASRGVLRQEGFGSADTIARLLADPTLQESVRGSLVLIDEAGLVGTRTMRGLFELAERQDARVLLVGDANQHGPVERGGALRQLEDEAGLRPAEITQIQRQKQRYKAAVEDLSRGDTARAFERLDGLGWVHEAPDGRREAALATAYVDAVRAGKTALVVSPTHAEGARITASIRDRLRAEGLLGGADRTLGRLVPANLTLGQKRDPVSYRPGDVLEFHQNARGYKKGQRVVVGKGPRRTELPLDLPIEQAERYTVYRPSTIALAAGDRVRITRGGRSADGRHALRNGDVFTVAAVTARGDIELDNGWTVARDFGHLAHGLVATSHASQGKTVDRVLIGQSAESLPASSRAQFYVSVSRGREQALVFTDDKAALLEAVGRADERLSASRLVRDALAEAGRRLARQRVAEPAPHPDRPDLRPAHAEREPTHER